LVRTCFTIISRQHKRGSRGSPNSEGRKGRFLNGKVLRGESTVIQRSGKREEKRKKVPPHFRSCSHYEGGEHGKKKKERKRKKKTKKYPIGKKELHNSDKKKHKTGGAKGYLLTVRRKKKKKLRPVKDSTPKKNQPGVVISKKGHLRGSRFGGGKAVKRLKGEMPGKKKGGGGISLGRAFPRDVSFHQGGGGKKVFCGGHG